MKKRLRFKIVSLLLAITQIYCPMALAEEAPDPHSSVQQTAPSQGDVSGEHEEATHQISLETEANDAEAQRLLDQLLANPERRGPGSRMTSLITTNRPHFEANNPGALTVEIQNGTLNDFAVALKSSYERGLLAPITKDDPPEIYVYVKSRFVSLRDKRALTSQVLSAYRSVFPDIKPRIVIASSVPTFEQAIQTVTEIDRSLKRLAENNPDDTHIQKLTDDARKSLEPLERLAVSAVAAPEEFEDQDPLTTQPISTKLKYGAGGIRAILIAATSVYASWASFNNGVNMGEAVGSVIALNSLLEFFSVVQGQNLGRLYEAAAPKSINVYREKLYRWIAVSLGNLAISSLGRTLLIQLGMSVADPVRNHVPNMHDAYEIVVPSLPGLFSYTAYFTGYRTLQEKGRLSITEADNMNTFVGILDAVITVLNTFKLYSWRYPVWFVQWGYYAHIAVKAIRAQPRRNRIVLVDGQVDDWDSRIKVEHRIRTLHIKQGFTQEDIHQLLDQIKQSPPMPAAIQMNCKELLLSGVKALRGIFKFSTNEPKLPDK